MDGDTHLITETRDDFGRSTGFIYSKNSAVQHTATTGYGTDGRISSAGFTHSGAVKQFGYEYLGGTNLLHKLTKPNGMTFTQSYEAQRDLLTGMEYHRGTTLVAQREYTYDVLSRPTARTTSRQGNVVNDSFIHNSRSELASAQVNGETYGYDYDNVGNRRMSMEAGDYAFYEANELNQYTDISGSEDEAEFSFNPELDSDGNQTSIKTETGIWSAVYNAENRPVSFTNEATGTVVTCAYDSMGRRSFKKVTVNGTVTLHQRYLYHGYLQIAACDLTRTAHPCLWLITWDPMRTIATRPLAIQKDGTWYTYGWDLTKNICELYGTNGYIATTYTYSPFGQVTASGNVTQPIQWSSEVWDGEMGLVYYNWRYYNAMEGKWISVDMAPSINNYSYIKNCSVSTFDVIGMESYIYYKEIDCQIVVYLKLSIIDLRNENNPPIQTMLKNIIDEGNLVWNPKNGLFLGCCKIKVEISGKVSNAAEEGYFPIYLVNNKWNYKDAELYNQLPYYMKSEYAERLSGSFVYTPIKFLKPYPVSRDRVSMLHDNGKYYGVYPDERVIPYFGVFSQDYWLRIKNGDVLEKIRGKMQYRTNFTYAHEIGHIMGLPDEYKNFSSIVDYKGDIMADDSVYSDQPIDRQNSTPSVRSDYYRRILLNLGKSYCYCNGVISSGIRMHI